MIRVCSGARVAHCFAARSKQAQAAAAAAARPFASTSTSEFTFKFSPKDGDTQQFAELRINDGMQWIVIAADGQDEGALERRLKARPEHLARSAQGFMQGRVLAGGAILDASETMRGSALILDFDTEEEVRAYLEEDPYAKQGVWKTMSVNRFKLARLAEIPLPSDIAASTQEQGDKKP